MNKIITLLCLSVLFSVNVFGQQGNTDDNGSSADIVLALVQEQLIAYNARDIESFLKPFAEDIEWYEFPDKLLGKGKDDMRKQYGAMFDRLPNLHCEIKQRITQGHVVIDKEYITGAGDKPFEVIAIYQVEDNKIGKVFFVR